MADLKLDVAWRTLATMFEVSVFVSMIQIFKTLPMAKISNNLSLVLSLVIDQLDFLACKPTNTPGLASRNKTLEAVIKFNM
jgi:hypothetical protein